MRTKHIVPDTYYITNDNASHKVCSEFDKEQAENTKSPERQKTSFPKQPIKNADFNKSELNEVMTTHK